MPDPLSDAEWLCQYDEVIRRNLGCGTEEHYALIGAVGHLRIMVAQRKAVLALADAAEHGATRWADPLPVPEWVGRVRAALGVEA